MLKIGLTGPHGSGKTTLLQDLKQTGRLPSIEFLPEITRTLKNQGFSINESGSDKTQLLILSTHIQNLFTKSNFIVDRCLLDGLIYTLYLEKQGTVPSWIARYAEKLCTVYIKEYSHIFYIPAEFDLPLDGTRSPNPKFHSFIKETFKRLVYNYGGNVIEITGCREDRVNKILSKLGDQYSEL